MLVPPVCRRVLPWCALLTGQSFTTHKLWYADCSSNGSSIMINVCRGLCLGVFLDSQINLHQMSSITTTSFQALLPAEIQSTQKKEVAHYSRYFCNTCQHFDAWQDCDANLSFHVDTAAPVPATLS